MYQVSDNLLEVKVENESMAVDIGLVVDVVEMPKTTASLEFPWADEDRRSRVPQLMIFLSKEKVAGQRARIPQLQRPGTAV